MLGIVAVIVLAGVGNLAAKEDCEKSGGKQKGQAKKLQQQEGMEQRHKGMQAGQKRSGQQMFNRWFNALIKAHREDDRETMGQLLRKMNQFRQRMQKGRDALGERMRTFRGWPGAVRGQAGRFHDDSGKWGRRFLRGGMGRWCCGFERRGMGRWGRRFPCRSMGGRSWKFRRRGICRPSHGMQRRGTGRWGRGFPSRGMGRWGQSIQRGGMSRPEPGMPCRVMCRWQRGIPKGHRGYESHGFRGRGMRDRREEKRRSEWDW